MEKVQTSNNRKYYYYNRISDKILSYEWMLPTTNIPTSYSFNGFPNLLTACSNIVPHVFR